MQSVCYCMFWFWASRNFFCSSLLPCSAIACACDFELHQRRLFLSNEM